MDLFPSKVKRENAQNNGAGPPVHSAIFLKENRLDSTLRRGT
jgi:hypothetical protein